MVCATVRSVSGRRPTSSEARVGPQTVTCTWCAVSTRDSRASESMCSVYICEALYPKFRSGRMSSIVMNSTLGGAAAAVAAASRQQNSMLGFAFVGQQLLPLC